MQYGDELHQAAPDWMMLLIGFVFGVIASLATFSMWGW